MIRTIEITYDDESTEFSVKHSNLDLFTFLGILEWAKNEAIKTNRESGVKTREAKE